jgi:hypothetical protein
MQRFDQPLGIVMPPSIQLQEVSSLSRKWVPEWRTAISELISTIEDWLNPLQATGKLRTRRASKLVEDPVLCESYLIDHLDIVVAESRCLSLAPISATHAGQPGRVQLHGLKQETVLLNKPDPWSDIGTWFLVFDESSPKNRSETQLSHGIFFALLTRPTR